MEEEFEKLTKDEILRREIIETVIQTPNVEIRERLLAKLESRAKELKIGQNFKRLYKSIQAEFIQAKKQVNSCVTEFTNAPLKLKCKNYICNDMGVVKSEFNTTLMMSVDTVVCSHPILPIERLINVDTNTEKVKIAFYKDKKWQTVIAEKNTLASKSKILQLANTGIEVNESNAKELIIYISDLLTINTETIPCRKAVTHLGWVEDGFVPYTSEYVYDGEDEVNKKIFARVREHGDYKIWQKTIKELRSYNEKIHLLTVASLASPFISILNITPFIVHLWGTSSKGKTLALKMAMSIWGYPDDKGNGLVLGLNNTQVGFERMIGFLHNIPYAGDEFQRGLKKEDKKDIDSLLYFLTGGAGKIRGNILDGVRKTENWSNIILTTGEQQLTENIDEGLANRIISLNENKSLIPDISKGKEIADILHENYGWAGKKMLTELYDKQQLKELFNENVQKFASMGISGKQINTFSCLKAIDDISAKPIFDDLPLTIEDYSKYILTNKNIDEADKVVEIIIDEANKNINNFCFFTMGQRPELPSGQVWGKIEKTTDGEKGDILYYYWIPSVLREVLEKHGINYDAKKEKLYSAGYLEKQSGKYTVNALMPDGYQKMTKIKNIYFNM